MSPVSAHLESDLRRWVQRHGMVVWLDADRSYSGFVERLRARRAEDPASVPFAVHTYSGSYLALLLELEDVGAGVDKPALLLHLPGFTEERVKASPLYEVYATGVRYRKALDTLVTDAAAERVRPEAIGAFLGERGVTLEAADAWLGAKLDERAGGLAARLGALDLAGLVDQLLEGGPRAEELTREEERAVLWDQLGAKAGLTAGWRERCVRGERLRPEDIAFAVTSWALCVEYVSDLHRAPVGARVREVGGLPPAVIVSCRALAAHLRARHPRPYTRWADETEGGLADEVAAARPEDLGKIDTFRFEEDKVLGGALAALAEEPEQWDRALAWSEPRVAGASFWVEADAGRKAAWRLIDGAARLGRAIAQAGPSLAARTGLEAALERYVTRGAAVDQAHRHLEQLRDALLHASVPERDLLHERLADARRAWRAWADDWARDFNTLCRREGFLPPPHLQQRAILDEVVRPLAAEPGITALFLVDALRFEMAQELYRALEGTPATNVQLKGRYAELPTVTEVGMNVLALSGGGRLRPALTDGRIGGFANGEFRVADPESRRRALADRVGGATCPLMTLAEVLGRDSTSLKQAIARARLVVVHSLEIDTAGENGLGPNAFESVLQKLRAAWQLLREAGVRRFVVTADHGYLLLDETAGQTAQPHGTRLDPKRRHVFSAHPVDHSGEVRVPLADLGYEGVSGHILFPESTAVFDTGKRGMSFVHGGNSLQERVIPVLTLVHRAPAGGDAQRYAIRATARDGVAGMACIEGRIETIAQGALEFGGARELDVALRATDAPEVRVEVCDVRGGARRVAGSVRAEVGGAFEVFFRLIGPADARVRVELYHPGAEANVAPAAPEVRFPVAGQPGAPTPVGALGPDDWLSLLPEGGVRLLFRHLASYGSVTEDEALQMLGTPRVLRQFALAFEGYAAKAPFTVRIETVGGTKRYVREENR